MTQQIDIRPLPKPWRRYQNSRWNRDGKSQWLPN